MKQTDAMGKPISDGDFVVVVGFKNRFGDNDCIDNLVAVVTKSATQSQNKIRVRRMVGAADGSIGRLYWVLHNQSVVFVPGRKQSELLFVAKLTNEVVPLHKWKKATALDVAQ